MDDVLQDHEEVAAGEIPNEASEAATLTSEPVAAAGHNGAPGWQPNTAQAPPPTMDAGPPPPQHGPPPPPEQPWYSQPGYYGAPQPGYPTPPGPPVMPPVQNGGDGHHSRGLMMGGICALVLLILGAGVAIVVAMSGSHPVVVAKPAAQTLSTTTSTAVAAAPQITRTVTKTAAAPAPPAASPTPSPSPTPTAGDATQIEAMLTAHFQDLVNGDYAGSFADLTGTAAGSAGSESEWISAQRTDGLYSFSLTVVPQVTSATTATAQITHFVTRASGSGCKTWTGDWSLVKENGQWLISDANLNGSLSPCNA